MPDLRFIKRRVGSDYCRRKVEQVTLYCLNSFDAALDFIFTRLKVWTAPAPVGIPALLDCPGVSRQIPASRRGPFEGLGTDAAQVTMAAGAVVKSFNVVEHV